MGTSPLQTRLPSFATVRSGSPGRRLGHPVALALGIIISQAGLFLFAGNTFGIGIYFVMHGSMAGSITPIGTAVVAVCFGGMSLSQGLAPVLAVPMVRAVFPDARVPNRWPLAIASILGPLAGLGVAAAVDRLLLDTEPGSLVSALVFFALWPMTAAAITAATVFWTLRTRAANPDAGPPSD